LVQYPLEVPGEPRDSIWSKQVPVVFDPAAHTELTGCKRQCQIKLGRGAVTGDWL
jgi:hypothetical protein